MAAKVDTSLPLEYQTEQNRLNIFGFWVFLGAEIALFSSLFAAYGSLADNFAGGPTPADLFKIKDIMIETILLLVSSFTCGVAVWQMRRGNLKGLITWMIITLLLGAGFVFTEVSEFVHYVHEGATIQTSAFLSSFFVLLGTHGAHVSLGICWAILVLIQLAKRGLTPTTARKVFIISLYWHFLDVVWIFIFTFVYLARMV